ncbi:aminopeptidase P family protein [Allobaculum stercoricanis]|uniref:aminopeptidase P family protein n=1 Tax=Allobaculum stercoricanis TaxID=174709 RepID=UPI00037A986C|nr:aminopeptidase P family protein [Allobaculum stercoricanis]
MESNQMKLLREKMREHDVHALIIPTSDFHDTEYVCDYFSARRHFSGFTGSAGVLVVLDDQAGVWTDGRYFIQAAKELEGSGIDLMKMGEKDTPTIKDYILDHLAQHQRVAFDGRCVSMTDFEMYQNAFKTKDLEIVTDLDLAGEAWPDRPALPNSKTFHYDEKYTGMSIADKLVAVREAMKKEGAKYHVLSKIDEVAWLYNLRAHDIPSFPVALAYSILDDQDYGVLYIDGSRLDDQSRELLTQNGIEIKGYRDIYADVETLDGSVLMDKSFINSRIGRAIQQPIWSVDPVQLLKAKKNPVEVEGFYETHRRDAVAMIQFWKWLEEEMNAGHTVTEIDARNHLHHLRSLQPEFVEDSFTTISAYGANASMPHYHPDEAHPVVIEPRGLYLLDSGGHYLTGTTDITRTFVVGELTDEEREAFTLVLQGHIHLSRAVFPKGACGLNLDIEARQPLWKKGLDFNHGTGHGVGCLLSVHEGPNGIRWRIVPERRDSAPLEVGMVTSNEPGVYVEGKFGIRHENLIVTKPYCSTESHDFLCHDPLTLVPFDVRGLDLNIMTDDEIEWLNAYHKRVYDTISPRLTQEEAEWLKNKTAPISKA